MWNAKVRNSRFQCATFSQIPSGFYSLRDDEIEESADLVVIGEDPPLKGDKTIPIRLFTKFAIYNSKTKELVDVSELISARDSSKLKNYGASGFISPWVEDDDDFYADSEDAFESQYVQLGRIRELNLFSFEKRRLDRSIFSVMRCVPYSQALQQNVYRNQLWMVYFGGPVRGVHPFLCSIGI